MSLESIDAIYQRAAQRKGGVDALNLLLGGKETDALVAELTDDRVLSAFTKKIFQFLRRYYILNCFSALKQLP